MGAVAPLRVTLALEIDLATALHIGTGLGLGQILNALTVQGPHPEAPGADLPYIPGSSLKGRLRYHVRMLAPLLIGEDHARSLAESDLFGFPEQPGALSFGDAHLADLALARELAAAPELITLVARQERSFVGLSRGRRVAVEGRLFRIDLAEHGLRFAALIEGDLPGPEPRARRSLGVLAAAISDLSHLGGYKARGLGRCHARVSTLHLAGSALPWKELVEGLA